MGGFKEIDGKKLQELREALMLSQRELARVSDTSQALISELELGKRRAQPRTVRKLAAALGVDPRDLTGEGH
jgi:transcriptional regulator with XRE-family HTH domain